MSLLLLTQAAWMIGMQNTNFSLMDEPVSNWLIRSVNGTYKNVNWILIYVFFLTILLLRV